ncbi:MAG: NAD(+)/NADH kinase [Acidimicrobiia bacterium]|nr:MAG: NAD(+)/NADH kinase [Acidimicrobiia bacterium]
MNRVRIVVRDGRRHTDETVRRLVAALANVSVTAGASIEDPEAIVAIGGDGTVLEAAAGALALDIPLCGVNVGRVGYLAEFEEKEITDLAEAIANDTYAIKYHSTVAVRTAERCALAINDVVVEKVISQRVIEVAVRVNGNELASYRTDGIIVASPLGSTAYSLSSGGPVVDPSLDALIMTPVAPHSLLTRPIVLAPDAVVNLTVQVDRPARINVDGRELCLVEPGDDITIERGSKMVGFLSLGRHPFPEAVREQFGLDHA